MEKNNSGAGKNGRKKMRNIAIFLFILAAILFVGIRFYYPFGEGVKAGQLNYVVYKGVIFKTYEGKLIQSGFRADKPGGIQSNEFVFSIADKELAEKLMNAGGQVVELKYKEYFGALPWRGHSKFVVYGIINITPVGTDHSVPPMSYGE